MLRKQFLNFIEDCNLDQTDQSFVYSLSYLTLVKSSLLVLKTIKMYLIVLSKACLSRMVSVIKHDAAIQGSVTASVNVVSFVLRYNYCQVIITTCLFEKYSSFESDDSIFF